MLQVVQQIYDILSKDSSLKTLVQSNIYATHTATQQRYGTTSDTNSTNRTVLYEVLPQSDNGCVAHMRYTVNVITATLTDGIRIIERIKQLLITKSDEELTDRIINVVHNGGGSMFDYNRSQYHNYIFLDITYRSEV